jgi:hypothetical protein
LPREPHKRARSEVPFDVSHDGQPGLIKPALCTGRLRVQTRGMRGTLHYILSKEPMKCVWDIVPVHVLLYGTPGRWCHYKVHANEFCQR